MFRKITAKDDQYVATSKKYFLLINEFKEYLERKTFESGKTKEGTSGKAASYARYLIRLIIIFQEFFPHKYITFRSPDGSKNLNILCELSGFQEYNINENRYPKATLNEFSNFIREISLEYEREADDLLNFALNTKNSIIGFKDTINESKATYGPISKKEKISIKNYDVYSRSIFEAQLAKQKSNWSCEYDNSHRTFINPIDNKPFTEAHHLIPMAYQDEFVYSIDFSENIVSLCPNCHRMIHFSKPETKKEMLASLYKKRKSYYRKYQIDINFEQLLIYYEINN